MPDGEMRRPPQLWEQRLARTTAILGAGISSSGDNTAIVPPTPPPGSGGGTEPAPVLPPPGDFIAPSTPTLIGSVQGINVVWNGLNSAGDLWPSDTSYVEVHMDTSGPTFTVGTATLKGRLARPGGLAVTGLSAGTTYYFRLRGADPAGNVTAAGTAASGQPGLINAPDIAANAITANSIVAGTITGWSINSAFLSGGTVSGGFITGGTVSGGYISGGTVSGSLVTGGNVQSASSGKRIVLNATDNQIDFYNSSGTKTADLNPVTIRSTNGLAVTGALDVSSLADISTDLYVGGSAVVTGFIYSDELTDTDSTSIPTLRVDTTNGKIIRTTHANSAQEFKHEIVALSDEPFAPVMDPDRLGDSLNQMVDPFDVLTLTPVQYRRNEAPASVVTGFIADDVEQKFPTAATYDERGKLEAIDIRGIVAGLLAVVRDQQTTIIDLRARIEALEA